MLMFSDCRQLHTSSNYLLLSLSVSDFLVGIVVMPIELTLTHTCWILGDLLCALYYFLPVITTTSSVGNMVLISVDRYVAICYPLHYPTKINEKKISICISMCWVTAVFYSIILLYDNLKHPGSSTSCHGECVVNILLTFDLILCFVVPISVIIFLYMRVFVAALSQARAMRSHDAVVTVKGLVRVTATKSEIKAARTLGILVVVFLMSYSPYYCVSVTGPNTLIGSQTEASMIFLLYFNSCLNPVIYTLFYPWFRKAIRLIVTLQILKPGSSNAKIL